jgi:phosphoglycerate dehydrogenase-like enzyme
VNVLITGAWRYTAADAEEIHALGHRVWDMPEESGSLPCDPREIDAVIGNNVFAYHPIEAFTRLQYVQLTSAGVDRVPLAYMQERGITLYNASGVYSIPMAEFALAGVLDLYKQGRYFDGNQSLHRWEKHRGLRELAGKTVCILGCGSVGNECALRFGAFGCRVIGIDPLPREDHRYEAMHAPESLKTWLPSAQVLVLCAPLTEETYHLLDRGTLALLPDGAVVVNLSRGAVVDTAALLQTMSERELYAVLDVFEEEPLPPDSPLWDLPNLRLSPHNSFVGEGNAKRLADLVLKNLREHGDA